MSGFQPAFNSVPVQSFSNQQPFLPPDHSLHQGADPNSPELFKQNIQLVQENVVRLQELAQRASVGIQHAYHPGNSPIETEANIASVKQTLDVIADIMRQSGVGALPLLPVPSATDISLAPPSEQQLMFDTNRSIQALYDKLKRSQDSAAVVANLLSAPDYASTRGARS
ncbi:hypothetical protein L208DRAFT_1377811 [Tricholoma matsutake]|nr:hypothetical protein L208DRAFT_1419074 [Tricholoma matsutake 945]KAF8232119.1 hypothetical protein L208DRAFT_1273694 [Tricholoma matsutake 945]KAF8232123.1 hypothetical protein L208DRAFT_1377811 [Tricholoma matsutake 945]